MTFKNIKLKDLGIIVQSVSGILDMPKRKGDTIYDWGDKYEALVSAEEIYFGTRTINVNAYFDERKKSFKDAMWELEKITDTQTLSTDYGDFLVRLDQISIEKRYKEGRTIKLAFIELQPDLSGGLPTISGDEGIRLDGHDLFVEFGLLVEQVKIFEIKKLKASKETVFKNNYLSVYREPQDLQVKVNGIYASKSEMTTKVSQLNACLAKEGLRHFSYRGDGFQCFATEGHKTNIIKNRVEIILKLKVMAYYDIAQIVKEVVDQVTIQAVPQSNLSETNVDDPSFIRGKETFVANDSNKLNGEKGKFYAKEAEIKALRDADLSAELEAETNF